MPSAKDLIYFRLVFAYCACYSPNVPHLAAEAFNDQPNAAS